MNCMKTSSHSSMRRQFSTTSSLLLSRHLDLASLGFICLIQGRVEFLRREGHGEFCYVVFLAN